jgi:hypothetical protein
MLPNFVIVGAAKAGTTALYWYLHEHPAVAMSSMKETNYFAYGRDESGDLLYGDPDLHSFPITTLEQYEALFPGTGATTAVGEASPIYLECPDAAKRIRDRLPDAKIICGLRDPVDRAYSDYLMYLRNRQLRFDAARDLSLEAAWAQPDSHWMRIGRYHDLLARYYDEFDRSRIHIYLFDDMRSDPRSVVASLYRFLEVDERFVPDFETPHNVGGVPTSMALEKLVPRGALKATVERWVPRRVASWVRRLRTANLQPPPPLPAELRARLMDQFRDDIHKTGELTEKDLSAWLR